jgi:hypothetical protein
MSPKIGHREKAYELLRKSDFHSPFTFTDWQLNQNYMPLREKLRERKYTVKDTGIPSRVINHWELSKLMPEGVKTENREKDASWRTFSLVEIAWLKIVSRLRGFGFSLKKIAAVKEQIIHWNKTGYYPLFEYYLAQSLFSPKDTYLRIFTDGAATLVSAEEIEMDRILKGSQDMLLISAKSILSGLRLDFPEIKNRLELSDEEFEMLDEIRYSGSSEIKAGIRDGKITEMEATKTSAGSLLDKDIRAEAEREGMYGRVITQFEKGKQRSVQIVKRKRFDK